MRDYKKEKEKLYKEDLDFFKKKNDKELIDIFNREVGNPGWTSSRATYLAALHQEFDNRGYDYSVILGIEGGLYLRHKVKLVGNKFELKLSKMEERLWKLMESWELFHHVNGIIEDNRLENLLLTNKKEYYKINAGLLRRIYKLVKENCKLKKELELCKQKQWKEKED